MSAHVTRREQDVAKLHELASSSGGKLRILHVRGSPPSSVEIEIVLPTAGTKNYPTQKQPTTRAAIDLGPRYPFVEPKVSIKTPIIHPNVYTSGVVCLGSKWLPRQGLDLLVRRLIQIVTFDPSVLNEQSPANRDALNWYETQRSRHPHAFPTASANLATASASSGITWVNKK